jgi:hypothetical protein
MSPQAKAALLFGLVIVLLRSATDLSWQKCVLIAMLLSIPFALLWKS